MATESRSCQNCKKSFSIEDEDFSFYEKMKVPAPTFCPECRFVRRYAWRNERALYKRRCGAPGHEEEMISMYAPEKEYTVYDEKYWWSDDWDAMDYGADYDFSKPFFEQYQALLRRVPLIGVSVTNNVDSPYCNISAEDKGCYMISASGLNENVHYSNRVANTKDSYDVYISDKNQGCYDLVDCNNCFNVFFSNRANNCIDSYFLYDCSNCNNCFGSVGLRNKSYYIWNQPYSKEEYFRKLKELELGSFSKLIEWQAKSKDLAQNFPRRYANNINCVNTTGDNVRNSKNAKFCFDGTGVEDSKFLTWVYMGIKDAYDIGAGSGVNVEKVYECWDTNFSSQNVMFSGVIYGCYDTQYSWNCHSSRGLFGCYGLRSKEYCILNKQYSKEEYKKLLPKIIEHMRQEPFQGQNGRTYAYGEFMPLEISPFAYNETIAQEYFPIEKSGAEKMGYYWRDQDDKKYEVSLASGDVPDNIQDAPDSIIKEIIGCGHAEQGQHPFFCESSCATAFRVTASEVEFCKNAGIPLPRLCPNCRHYRRVSERNPIALWKRKCMCGGLAAEADTGTSTDRDENGTSGNGNNASYKNTAKHFHDSDPCPNEFETSYNPERPEIVYCEQCYQTEVL